MSKVYPLNIVEIQLFDSEGNIILRLPDPIFMNDDGMPSIQLQFPEGFDLSNVASVKEILDGE